MKLSIGPGSAPIHGTKIIGPGDTSTHTGPFAWAKCIGAVVVDTATTTGVVGTITGKTYSANNEMLFQIDTIKLTSGEIHCYYRDPGMIEGFEASEGAPFQF